MEILTESETDNLCVNTLRFLAVDAVEQAKSGHPGLPLGVAPMAYVLWDRFLRYNPRNPAWFNRYRFILSARHGSASSRLAILWLGLELKEVARIWRGGCIIRAALLEDIFPAYAAKPDLANLLLDSRLFHKVVSGQADLRAVIQSAVQLGIPVPALMASLAY